MVKKNSCVFISGAGTNLKALIKSSREYKFPINIKLIISNKRNAMGLLFARRYSIPFKVIKTKNALFEKELINEINKKKNIFNLPCRLYENIIKEFYKQL